MAHLPPPAPLKRLSRLDRRLLLGYLAALGAALCYGSSHIFIRQVTTELTTPLVAATYGTLFGGLFLLGFVGRDLANTLRIPRSALAIVLLAGVAASGGVVSIFFALSLAQVTVVIPIISTFPLITLILAGIFLRQLERVTPRLVLGTLLVLGGVILVILG